MFVRRLLVTSPLYGTVRDVSFHGGLNLIVDETPASDNRQTGNNVGKTTVLKLIDYCLGGNAKELYSDPESKGAVYGKVKDFLENGQVVIQLELVDQLDSMPLKRVVIRRNFGQRKMAIREINGEQIPGKDFEKRLGEEIFPQLPEEGKPTFRQVISHNIRYSDEALTHTLNFVNRFTSGVEYEAVHLFMLGCPRPDAQRKQELAQRQKTESAFVKKLKNGWTTGDYRAALDAVDAQIGQLERERERFEQDSDLARDLEESASLKSRISGVCGELTQIEVRVSIIREAEESFRENRAEFNLRQLRALYEEAGAFMPELHRTFEELVKYHNAMISEKARFITSELPALEERREVLSAELSRLEARDRELSRVLAGKMSSDDFEEVIVQLNELFQQKGAFESRLSQLESAEEALSSIADELEQLEEEAKAGGLKARVDQQLKKLNERFAKVSQDLYGETYIISYDEDKDRSGTPFLKFKLINVPNLSAGKKQGEILCFDIAYTGFADEEGIDCLHFVLNDKKELMHGNQLASVNQVALENDTQIIVSMLKDKLPAEMATSRAVVLTLSQESKFFRIEELADE